MSEDIARLMVENGADVGSVNKSHQTMFDEACKYGMSLNFLRYLGDKVPLQHITGEPESISYHEKHAYPEKSGVVTDAEAEAWLKEKEIHQTANEPWARAHGETAWCCLAWSSAVRENRIDICKWQV